MARKLTDKEEAFCREYLIDWNTTQAAIRAGYSKRTAATIGSENLRKPHIKAKIKAMTEEQSGRLALDADFVISRFMVLADFSIKKVASFDGESFLFKPMDKWPDGADRAVKSIKQVTTTRTTSTQHGVTENTQVTLDVKFEDKQTALDALGRHLGLFMSFDQAVAAMETYGYGVKELEDGSLKLEKLDGN
jgi:phage terminase small subunit